MNETTDRDIGLHLSRVINYGFNFAIKYCEENAIEYEYLGNVDGDLVLEKTFFENLILQFEMDEDLGIASGGTEYHIGDKRLHIKTHADEPSGGHMLIRKECFEACNGIPVTYAADAVLKAKARLRGWRTRRFEENLAVEMRDVSSADGYWKGYITKGITSYYINQNPMHVMGNAAKYLIRRPHYIFIPYLFGYINCVLHNAERVDDPEVKNYFHNKWKECIRRRL